MNEFVSNFVQRFHNLEGVSIDEKKHHFFRHLQENSVIDYGNLESIINRLKPKNHLEKILFIDLLIYYRCFNELYVEFMKGNDIAVSKLSKEKWFFQKAFQKINSNFVNDVLPTVSYSTRMKILRKLKNILSEVQCNEIFDAICRRYGVFMATNVLLGCSIERIEDTLRHHPIKLETNQLKLLYKKKPDLIFTYLEEYEKHNPKTGWLNNNPILKFIALENSEMFCNIQEKYQISYYKIGKRTTKKLVKYQKERIIAKPKLYAQNLHKIRLVRTLGEDFQKFYFNLYPRQISQIFGYNATHLELLKYYPKQYKFELFKTTFDGIFEEKLETRSHLIDKQILEMIPTSDLREKWVNIKRQHKEENEDFKYLKADKCVTIIEAKFNTAGKIENRLSNITTMTQSCLLNKDWKSFLQVLELLCTKFKNEDIQLYIRFLESIEQNQGNVLDNLDHNHWELMRKILSRWEIKVSGHYNPNRILYKYFQFLARTRSDYAEVFLDFIKESFWCQNIYTMLSDYLPKTNVKKFLLFLVKNRPKLCKAEIIEVDVNLIIECFKYNRRCTNDIIDVWEHNHLINSLQTVLSNSKSEIDGNVVASAVKDLICNSTKLEKRDKLSEIYWNNFDSFANISIANWFLKNAPKEISDTEKLFKSLTESSFLDWWDHRGELKKIWFKIKNYSHLSFDNKLVEYGISRFKDANFNDKASLAYPLSMLMPQNEFFNLIDSYKPVKTNINLQDPSENAQYQIQRNLLKSLINIKEPEKACSIILQFFQEDYVGSCLSPLYSCLYRIPENNLSPILTQICQKNGVSAKKHGYYFACVTLDQNTLLSSLQSCQLSQSIAMTYQYFVKNPSESSWKLLNIKLPKLDKNDNFTKQVLINRPAPKAYKSRYFVFAYEEFKKQNNRYTHVLVDKLSNDTIGELDEKFLLSIKNDFLSMAKSERIFASYLVYSEDRNKYQMIFNVLRGFREKHWALRAREPRENLSKFVSTIFDYYMEWEKTDEELVTSVVECFQMVFSYPEIFEEFLALSLMRFKGYTLSNFGKAIIGLNNQLVADCGEIVIPSLAKVLNQKLSIFCKTEELQYEFYFLLVEEKNAINDLLLITQLLPKSKPELIKCVRFYNDIMKILESVEDDKVKVHLYELLY